MGIKDDEVEFTGSQLERMLYWMKENNESGLLIQDESGDWVRNSVRPSEGSGAYIEVMPNGERRKYFNLSESDTSYQLI